MSVFGFLGISITELFTIICLIVILIFLCKNKPKICIWLISILLIINIVCNWNVWFNIGILLKESLVGI